MKAVKEELRGVVDKLQRSEREREGLVSRVEQVEAERNMLEAALEAKTLQADNAGDEAARQARYVEELKQRLVLEQQEVAILKQEVEQQELRFATEASLAKLQDAEIRRLSSISPPSSPAVVRLPSPALALADASGGDLVGMRQRLENQRVQIEAYRRSILVGGGEFGGDDSMDDSDVDLDSDSDSDCTVDDASM